jgi:hypothetical protein
LEQKSEKVQNLLTSMLGNLMKKSDSFSIETSSFLINYFLLNSSNMATLMTLQNSLIKVPSFCDLTYSKYNCSQENIIIKVYQLTLEFFKEYLVFLFQELITMGLKNEIVQNLDLNF